MACAFSIWTFLWAFTRGKSKYILGILFANAVVLLMLRPQQAISHQAEGAADGGALVPATATGCPPASTTTAALLDADRRRGH
jgi:hypothetical protein